MFNKILKKKKSKETEELFGTTLDEVFEQIFEDKMEEQEQQEQERQEQETYSDIQYKDSDLWTIKDNIVTPFSDLWSISSTTNASMINHYDNDKISIYSENYVSADETIEDSKYNRELDMLLECYDY